MGVSVEILRKQRMEKEKYNDEDAEYLYGIEAEHTEGIKDRIQYLRKKKGRGILISLHSNNEEKRVPRLIKMMRLGFKVGLVSDAGTPTISDPGALLIQEAVKSKILIESLPGPCSAISAYAASGLQKTQFSFYGFLPKKESDKNQVLKENKNIGLPFIYFDTQPRLLSTLMQIKEIYGKDHLISISSEISKIHESHQYGKVGNTEKEIKEGKIKIKGEITIVVGAGTPESKDYQYNILPLQLASILKYRLKAPDKEIRNIISELYQFDNIVVNSIMKHIHDTKS